MAQDVNQCRIEAILQENHRINEITLKLGTGQAVYHVTETLNYIKTVPDEFCNKAPNPYRKTFLRNPIQYHCKKDNNGMETNSEFTILI